MLHGASRPSGAPPTMAQARCQMGWARQVYSRMLGGWVSDLLALRQAEHRRIAQAHGELKKAA